MHCNRSLNNNIDRLHELSLRKVYSDKTSDFGELLEKDGSVSIHYQNIRQLATEMFKVSKRQRSQFHISLVQTVLVVQRVLNFSVLKFRNLYQMK